MPLDRLRLLVLDEADRLLDSGFVDKIQYGSSADQRPSLELAALTLQTGARRRRGGAPPA